MPNVLLAESGSTKTDWCLLRDAQKMISFKTSGINPYLQSPEELLLMLQQELKWKPEKHPVDSIHFYGAGAGSKANQKLLGDTLQRFFKIRKISVQGDLMAAARSLCGHSKGIVCILGTGSNSCYYDGKMIKEQQPSLGYIVGDEGSGNHMGKRVLQYYAYQTFDTELRMSFEMLFGNDLHRLVGDLYRKPFPNRYLAGMVKLLVENRGHFMVENIIEDCLNDFFHYHILKYRQSWKQPLHFTGSVAYYFKDVIESLCHQYELECGSVVQSPLKGLIRYHQQ